MDKLLLQACEDGTCWCLPPRISVACIAISVLIASTVEQVTLEKCVAPLSKLREFVDCMRVLLVTGLQLANVLLLLASIVENAFLVRLYVWYTLGFVLMGLIVYLLEFLLRFRHAGAIWSCTVFVADVAFMFALFRCLPLVDTYGKHLSLLPFIYNL